MTDGIVRGDIVVRPSWSDDVAKEIVDRNPDLVAIAVESNSINDVQHNNSVKTCLDQAVHRGSVVVSLGDEMTCTHYQTTEALNSHLDTNPDLDSPELGCLLRDLAEQIRLDRLTYAAFPAEAAQEAGPRRFDTVLGKEDVAEADQQDVADAEQDMLDQIPLPGMPEKEGERRKEWAKVPLRVRTAIRRLHRQYGHVPNKVLIQLMKLSRMAPEYIEAVKNFRCDACEHHKPLAQTHKVAMPKKFCFNHEVGVDCLEAKDNNGMRFT